MALRVNKGKRRLVFSFCVLVVLSFGVWINLSHQKPAISWKGHPSSYWIGRLNFHDLDNGEVSAEEFLFAAGNGVVPELVRGLRLRDNWLSDKWTDVYFKLGKWQRYFKMPVKRSAYRANCARGLALLGAAASEAESALLQCLKDKDLSVRGEAAEALSRIAEDKSRVAPALVAGLASKDQNHRLACIIGLAHCLPGSAEAAQALRASLRDPDSNKRAWAADGLWRDNSDREKTFASLLDALQDGNATVRDRAAQSMGRMHYNPERAAEALCAALTKERAGGSNEVVVWKILGALAELGPAAKSAVPVLKDLARADQSDGVSPTSMVLAVTALARIEPENPQWIVQLIRSLHRSDGGVNFSAAWELGKHGESARNAVQPLLRLAETAQDWRTKGMAAAAAWRLDSSSPNPLNSITNHLAREKYGGYEMVQLLGELGPAAKPAVPTLRQLRYSQGTMMHDYANEALRRIAPEYLTNPWKD